MGNNYCFFLNLNMKFEMNKILDDFYILKQFLYVFGVILLLGEKLVKWWYIVEYIGILIKEWDEELIMICLVQ